MPEIIEDAVDIDCQIGGDTWEILNAEVVLTRSSTPNYVDMEISPAPETPYPSNVHLSEEDGGFLGREFTLDAHTELRTNTPQPEVSRLFTGAISNMTPTGEYTFEAIAHDPSQEPFISDLENKQTDFMNSTVTLGLPTGVEDIVDFIEGEKSIIQPVLISDVVNEILDEAGIPEGEDHRDITLDEDGIVIGESDYGTEIRSGYDEMIQFDSWEVNVEHALTRAAEASESNWWFDRYGVFHFGAMIPDEDVFAYELEFITDSSAGITTPPYRSVKVIGDGVVSEEGWSKTSLISENKYSPHGNIIDPQADTEEGPELLEPTFTYRNMQISTAAEAKHIRNELINDLKEQRADGTITVVGFPEIYPNHAIEMPDSASQPFDGIRYSVNEVVHRLNNDDGFITKIKVGGPMFEQEAVYESIDDESATTVSDVQAEEIENSRPFRTGQIKLDG